MSITELYLSGQVKSGRSAREEEARKKKRETREVISPLTGALAGGGLGLLSGMIPYAPLLAFLDPTPLLGYAALRSIPKALMGAGLGAGSAMLYNIYRKQMEE